MAPSVQNYFSQGLAQSTRRSYDTAMRRFHAFCVRFNMHTPFPVSEYVLCCFAAYLADEGLAPQMVKCYLAAVRSMQLSLGLPDPRDHSSLPMLKRVLAGISRAKLGQPSTARPRLPITGPVLLHLHDALVRSSRPEKHLIWTVASLAFFGFFRLGELLVEAAGQYDRAVHLSWGDVAVDNRTSPSMVKVHLKRSKCDQFGRGVDVVVGRTDTRICPVAAVVSYIARRQDLSGPFFINSHGGTVTKSWFVQQVRTTLASLGLPQGEYAGHSFRIGAATSAALAGVEDSTIQALGRWQSSAFLQYIRMPQEQLAAISRRLALAAAGSHVPGHAP